MQNLANAVDNRLIRNDQRKAAKEGAITGLYAEMQKTNESNGKELPGKSNNEPKSHRGGKTNGRNW